MGLKDEGGEVQREISGYQLKSDQGGIESNRDAEDCDEAHRLKSDQGGIESIMSSGERTGTNIS